MKHRTSSLFFAASLAGVIALGGLATDSQAQKRVVVLEIEGARSARLQKSVSKLIAKEHRVISGSKFKKAAKRFKLTRLTPENVAKVAAKLDADGVLQGMIVADHDRYVLRLRLREGASGRTVKKLAVRLRAAKLSPKMRRALSSRLLSAIDDLPFMEAAQQDEPQFDEADDDDVDFAFEEDEGDGFEEEAPPKRVKRDRKKAKRRKAKRRKAKRRKAKRKKARRVAEAEDDWDEDQGDDDGDDFGDDFDDDDDDDDDDPGIGRSLDNDDVTAARAPGAIRVDAGVSLINRNLAFESRAGLAEAPKGYAGPVAPAAYVSGELYPLAMNATRNGPMTGIGIGFMVERVMSLETTVADGTMTAALPTNHLHYGVRLKYRHKFGNKSIKISVGYNRLNFTVDRSAAPAGLVVDVPNTAYTYFDPGLEIRVPVHAKLAFNAHGRAMLVTDAGEVQQPEQYGAAKLTGFDAGLGLEYMYTSRLVFTASGRVMAIGYEFQGNGDQSNGRDGDPSTVDIGGALDRYISGQLTAGYLF